MSEPIYLDECVNTAIAAPLRQRSIDVTTASEQRTLGLDDESQLLFAARRSLVFVTHNQKDFQQLHTRFQQSGRLHAGIVLVPQIPPRLVTLRLRMLVAWMSQWETVENRLIRWHDLQGELIRGLRVDGFTEAEVRQALAIDPLPLA